MSSPARLALALAVAAACAPLASAQLSMQTWPNTAFAPPAAAVASTAPGVAFEPASPLCADFSSVRLTGTITDSVSELVQFTANTEGGVRLWIDDHLVITDGATHDGAGKPSLRQAFLKIPFVAGVPQPFRLEYSRWGGAGAAPPTLELWWQGNATAMQIVPPSAFAPVVAAAELQRVATRDRLVNPLVQWQTYDNPTMGAHVLMPAGLRVAATLANAADGKVLGDLSVFRRSDPALLLAGLHSLNGSDYTQLSVGSWGAIACDVSLETTVVAGELFFLASANGSDCAGLLLLVRPGMMEERFGTVAMGADKVSATATVPGFAPVTVRAVGAAPVPFSNGGDVYLALPLGDGAVVGYYATGSAAPPPPVAAMQAAIAAARAVVQASFARYGELADIYEAMASILAWNTMFTPIEGVVTPVSRGWDFGAGYVIFDWDNLFLAFMASFEDGTLKDIAYVNLVQIVQARTLLGFVPNFASGTGISFDRTEPQIGALVVQKIYNRWGDGWVVDLLFPALLSWNDWVWTHRRGEGSLAGADGHADLIVLGSDPTDPPCGIGGFNNLQAARYESGLDNSPMYDGADRCCGDDACNQGAGPVCFYNESSHTMNLYDVGMTALFLSDTDALIALAEVAGRFDIVPELQQRFARVQAAMNAHMWDAQNGIFTNVLYNGSFYRRWAPTSFFPMISGSVTDAQADALMAPFTSPLGFCFNRSHTPDPNAEMLVQWWNGKNDNWACSGEECTREAVDAGKYNFVRVEAVTLAAAAPVPAAGVALNHYYSAANDDHALVAGAAPAAGYAFVRQEAWCWSAPPAPASVNGWPAANITLWYSASRKDFKTCGSDACAADSGPDYVARGAQCVALSGAGPQNLPCKFGGNSVARGDPAFYDNDYWR
jgi:putative isomerase